MGKEYNDMRRKATRMLAQKLSSGAGMTIEDMTRTVQWEFGLGRRFVLDFLDNFSNAVKEDNGYFVWKA